MRKSNPRFAIRKVYIGLGFTLVILFFIYRLFYLQLLSDEYKIKADGNAFYEKIIHPSRGMIYDAKGKLVVYNKSSSNIMVVTKEVTPFDTLELARILNVEPEYIAQRFVEIRDKKKNRGYTPFLPQLLISQISDQEVALLQEKLYRFPGFSIESRTVRDYNHPVAALILGSIGEVQPEDIERDPYYIPGDYSGRTGLEASYEKILRGVKGVEVLLRDSKGRIQGKYKNGELDKEVVSGHDLHLGLDIELQAYGEKLMWGKRGAIVMIEPETGLVRCMVSAPSFNPGMLVGKERGKNHNLLAKDTHKPLFNRAIMGTYPPGSTFKLAQGAVFLAENVITPNTVYSCHGGYPLLGGRPKCHPHGSPLSIVPAIATSCNAFFCWGLRAMLENKSKYGSIQNSFDIWKDHMVAMGFGYPLKVDLPGEKRGYIPNSQVYDNIFKKQWNSSSIISISIGQGEILTTPLQIANLATIIANKGHFYTPHLVERIDGLPADTLHIERRSTKMPAGIFQYLDQGMAAAVTGGTCRKAAIPGIEVCGKTGTAENAHGEDHSIFMGYAPRNAPKIAICVYVENAGFGASFAVPIARLMMEKYLKPDEELSPDGKAYEQKMLSTQLIPIHPEYGGQNKSL